MERKIKLPPQIERLVKRAEADLARQRKEKGVVPIKSRGTIRFSGKRL